MATEVRYPDALITQTGLTGAVTAIDDDADTSASDADYLSSNGETVCTLIASFPTPSGNPTTGAGVQNFRFRARITGAAGAPQTLTWRLYNDSNATLQSGTVSVTSTSFATYTVSWDAANLTVADGSSVRIYLSGGYSGNPSFSRWSWEISALEWNVTYSTGAATLLPVAVASAEALGSPSVVRGAVGVLPVGVGSAEALGEPAISAAATLLPVAVASAEAAGEPAVTPGAVSVLPVGMASAEAPGEPSLSGAAALLPVPVASAEAAGEPAIARGAVTVAPDGAGSAEAIGTPAVGAAAGYPVGYYCAITLSASLSPSNLSDYTAWITAESVSAAVLSSIQAHARADLNDVRFSLDVDGDAPVPHIKIHAAPGSDAWAFLVGPLDYTASTALTLYMHWGDASLTTDASSAAAFPDNVIGAWSPRDTGNLADLSGNGHTLTASGTISTSTDASHPSGAWSYSPVTLTAYLYATGQDLGGICDTQSCSIETLCKHYSDNSGWFAAVGNLAAFAYFGQYYATAGQVYYITSRPSGSVQTGTPVTSGQSSAWTYFGAVYDQSGPYVSGRMLGVALSLQSVPAINTTMDGVAVLSNTAQNNPLDASVALVILRNVALSADWMAASDRLANAQSSYVTYAASVGQHGDALLLPSGVVSAEAAGAPAIGRGTVTLSPIGALSGEALGQPTVVPDLTLLPIGVASAEAAGLPRVASGALFLSPAGVASAEAAGTPAMVPVYRMVPQGIASAEAIGSPALTAGPVSVSPVGVASAGAVALPIVHQGAVAGWLVGEPRLFAALIGRPSITVAIAGEPRLYTALIAQPTIHPGA